jgi:hypothetical protein
VTSFVKQTVSIIFIVLISEARIGRRNIFIGNVWPKSKKENESQQVFGR